MPNLTALKRPPSDLADVLRGLADKAERGELTQFVAAHCANGGYDFVYGASLHEAIVLAAMLQANCIDRMRR